MQKGISLCLITSKEDLENAKRVIEEMKPHVDEVCLTVTDTSFDEKITGVKVSTFEWIDDFAAARNFNFSQATREWIVWLDADDSLTNAEELRALIDQAESKQVEGFFFLYKYAFDKNGNCIDEHWKAQFLKNNGHFNWIGAIHEDPIQTRKTNWARYNGMQRIHKTTEEAAKKSYARNLRILESEALKNPDEPRTHFYLGRTYMAEGKLEEAIKSMLRYLELSGWDDERYEATLIIGRCYFMGNNLDLALEWYHRAILEKEKYPDAYAQKGFLYLTRGEYEKALYNFAIASKMDLPTAATYFNPMVYSRDLYIGMASCYLNMGKLNEALGTIQVALRADPKAEYSKELLQIITSVKRKNDTARKYVEIAKYLDNPKRIQTLLNSVPPELSDNEFIVVLKNTYQPPKKWAAKSIAVYCGPTAETWTPKSVDEGGIGGSETAVVELTKRLAKLGWDVTVFNQCDAPPKGMEFDGVKYQNYWTFNIADQYDVLWSWRLPELFEYDLKARLKILDMHDVMTPAEFTPERLSKIDKIFVKTNYHRSLYPLIEDDKFVVVGNGIDLTRFDAKTEKDPYRFCYTSSPNRGLDIVLKVWPKIKEALPEATLHVYYGWKTYYELEKNNPERMLWMKKVQGMMDTPGVIDHGRVGQKELAEDLLKTTYWLYPTYFPEIDCITAKEMQAAGVIPITSGYAALEESQVWGVKLPGDVYDPEWQEQYISTTINLAKTEHGETMDVSQFNWDLITTIWNKELLSSGKEMKTTDSD